MSPIVDATSSLVRSPTERRVFVQRLPAVVMGCGAVERLSEIVRSFAHGAEARTFVITDPGVASQPFFGEAVLQLERAGIEVGYYDQVAAEPSIPVFTACAERATRFGAKSIVGIGGGSALDVAKVVAVLARHGTPLESLFGIDQVPGRGFPTTLVPTTAGTGSEVTPIAVVSDEGEGLKKGIVSECLVADYAIVDPLLCLTLPPWPTAYTGMDALTHAIEAYTNRHAVPLIDAYALEAIGLIAEHLRTAVGEGTNETARYAMSRASMLGGMCLGPVNTAAVHALAYPLGGRFHVPHGVANSLLLPHVMRFNQPAVKSRYERIAAAMGRSDGDAVAAVEELSADVKTDRKMRDYGVSGSDLASMATAAMEVKRLLNNNPRQMNQGDALAIYAAAL